MGNQEMGYPEVKTQKAKMAAAAILNSSVYSNSINY
jgi:hypothetical protein